MERAFSPSCFWSLPILGRCPRLVWLGPSALQKSSYKQSPIGKIGESAEGAAPCQPGATPQENMRTKEIRAESPLHRLLICANWLHGQYRRWYPFSCAWVRPRRMRDCLENSRKRRQTSGSESVSESKMSTLKGRYRYRFRPRQTKSEAALLFHAFGCAPGAWETVSKIGWLC